MTNKKTIIEQLYEDQVKVAIALFEAQDHPPMTYEERQVLTDQINEEYEKATTESERIRLGIKLVWTIFS